MRKSTIILLMALAPLTQPAEAMMLPSAADLARARVDAVLRVRTVCDKQWDGYAWQERCRTEGTRHISRHASRSALRSRLYRLQRRAMRYLRYW